MRLLFVKLELVCNIVVYANVYCYGVFIKEYIIFII